MMKIVLRPLAQRFGRFEGLILGLAPAAILTMVVTTLSNDLNAARAAASAPEPRKAKAGAVSYAFSDQSEVTFTAFAPIRKDGVHGTTRQVRGSLQVPGGRLDRAKVEVRIPILSFRGKPEMIQHACKAVRAARFPEVVFKGERIAVTSSESRPDGNHVAGKIKGTLDFHGIRKPIEAPFQAVVAKDGAKVSTEFPVSLTEFGVEKPKIMFVEVDDAVKISADLVAQKI
jgi:polyisoprenoid-binding protein YceI